MLIHSYHIDGKSAAQLGHERPWLRTVLATLTLRVKRFWTEILTELGQTQEPHVWQTTGRQGQIHWCVYDPNTGDTLEQLTEQEVRIWLEKRYSY
jgi:hypothetical protein